MCNPTIVNDTVIGNILFVVLWQRPPNYCQIKEIITPCKLQFKEQYIFYTTDQTKLYSFITRIFKKFYIQKTCQHSHIQSGETTCNI